MKSLTKALDILEYVLNCEGRPVTAKAAAEATGTHPVTALRILGELAERSYLCKVSRREGFAAGPAVYALSDRRCFYGCAAHAAGEVLRKLAVELDLQFNLSVLDGGRRYILYHYSPNPGDVVWRSTSHVNDFYVTGTGRVLLAFADRAERDAVVAAAGMPGEAWPEVRTRADLERELAAVRRAGRVSFRRAPDAAGVVRFVHGAAVRVPGFPACAVGTRVNGSRGDTGVPEAMEQAAREIERNILWQQESF